MSRATWDGAGVSPERAAAGWLAEAFETGAPLAPLPDEVAPRTRRDASAQDSDSAGGVPPERRVRRAST